MLVGARHHQHVVPSHAHVPAEHIGHRTPIPNRPPQPHPPATQQKIEHFMLIMVLGATFRLRRMWGCASLPHALSHRARGRPRPGPRPGKQSRSPRRVHHRAPARGTTDGTSGSCPGYLDSKGRSLAHLGQRGSGVASVMRGDPRDGAQLGETMPRIRRFLRQSAGIALVLRRRRIIIRP